MWEWQKIDTEVEHVTDWLGVNVEGRQAGCVHQTRAIQGTCCVCVCVCKGVGLRFGLSPCCPLSLGHGHFLV